MTRAEQISREAAALTGDQQEAALEFIRALKRDAFYYTAPPGALTALDHGLSEIAAGRTVGSEEVFARIDEKLKARGA
jgi:predicted transcriptional regulator